jgi:hypothetical protein
MTRTSKIRCLIHNFEIEEDKKGDLTKRLNDINMDKIEEDVNYSE